MERSKPEPFLRLVANAFLKAHKSDMHRLCFVFPNRRSGVFFTEELSALAKESPILSPKITTITDFLNDITGAVEVSKIEALFILYSKYKLLMGDKADDFDRFSYWGDIILNDFNDVDKYLANPQVIFKNIRDFKEISSNFLTEEQIEVISRYFGDNWLHQNHDDTKFWKNPEIYGEKATDKFSGIWNILYELYKQFNEELASQGLSYSGKIYRDAVDRIKNMGSSEFPYSKYIFVGFNVLSLSEIKIFEYLGEKGIADYYWDCNSPAFADNHNKASFFIQKNKAQFKSKLDLNETVIDYFSPIHTIGIPSNIGQAKYTSEIINELINAGAITNKQNAINTAIVLPDEGLFSPLLDSITDNISDVNITMGYPLRLSSISILMTQIAKMHKQARKSGDDYGYFHEDVTDILAHPFIKSSAPAEVSKVMDEMFRFNQFYISANRIKELAPTLLDIFTPINDTKSPQQLIDYAKRLIQFIERSIMASGTVTGASVEMGFISQYIDLLNQLANTVLKYNFEMNSNTFFYLIGRLLGSANVAFEGEPMKGLQIMGILETRCLDFDNIIILSMNERVFPRKHYSRSFIPNNLRKAFGMATVEFQDCMYAYYFFRMISRAKNIYLLYDARTQAIGSGEPSRYIEQIRVLYPQANITKKVLNFSINVPKQLEIAVEKNGRIQKLLDRYRTPDSGCYLSASSINKYINCPLSFYFEKVEDLKIADEVTEFMNESTLGTIVHSVMNQLYEDLATQHSDRLISPNKIDRLIDDTDKISRVVTTTINKIYSNIDNCNEVLTGETLLIRDAIIYYVKSILYYDKDLGGFKFLQAEKDEKLSWELPSGIRINIHQFIDRVDEITDSNNQPILRIVDYKTGKDKTAASTVGMMFDAKSNDRRKAMLQLMIYCNVYSYNAPDRAITPVIYSVRNMKDSGFKIGKDNIDDFHKINDDFLEMFDNVISEMFNPDIKFTQTQNTKNCEYCKFTSFCHR